MTLGITQCSILTRRRAHETLRIRECHWLCPDGRLDQTRRRTLNNLEGDGTQQVKLIPHQVLSGSQDVEVHEPHLRQAMGMHPYPGGHRDNVKHVEMNDIERSIVPQFISKAGRRPESLRQQIEPCDSVASEHRGKKPQKLFSITQYVTGL
jgi:hypothetical protein